MADEQRQQLIAEFTDVTGTDAERAKFFLQAANWELHTALGTFYDEDSDEVVEQMPTEDVNSRNTSASTDDAASIKTSATTSKGGKAPGNSRFATLSSYSKEESSDEEEEGQAFYAGGSETSGQQIIGPNKKKDPTQALFDAAKSHGAEVVTEEPPRKSTKNSSTFQGAGFKLGSNVDPSEQIGESLSSKSAQQSATKQKDVKIKFWKNGFSVDNGPLRDFNDSEHKDFLGSIGRGEVPLELRRQAHEGEVHVNMEDHREEEYKKPKETVKLFQGAGHTLGSPTPNIVQDTPLPPVAATSSLPSQPAFKVDENKPITTIQIRLADGTRLVTKFNTDNTIGDIRNVVRNARPGNNTFKLMTTFPNKVLENDSDSIETAKLQNAVIVQRMT